MKCALLLAFSLSLAGAVHAVTPDLPLNVGALHTQDGRDYKGAVIVGVDNYGVKIRHDSGIANVPFGQLPDNLLVKFADSVTQGQNRMELEAKVDKEEDAREAALKKEKAELALQQQAEATDEPAVPTAPPAPAPRREAPKPPALAKDADPEVQDRIASLKSYIARLERGIDKTQSNIDRLNSRESYLRSRAEYYVYDYYGYGYSGVNGSLVAKANFVSRQASREGAKIREAERLISQAKEKIAQLERLPADAKPQSTVSQQRM